MVRGRVVSIEQPCPLWVISGHFAMRERCLLCAKSRHSGSRWAGHSPLLLIFSHAREGWRYRSRLRRCRCRSRGRFRSAFFRLCPFSPLRLLHPLLLSRRGTALCLLGFLRHVQYPDQNDATAAQQDYFLAYPDAPPDEHRRHRLSPRS